MGVVATTPRTAGLTSAEAALRLSLDGPNELAHAPPTPAWRTFLAQLRSPMIVLLLAAATVAGAMGELADAAAIVVIVLLNAVVGFLQESRAEQAVLGLRSLTAPRARVRRDGQAVVLPATEVVLGDHLLLEAGDVVAADATLVEAHRLSTNETALTGESTPVEKRVEPSPADAPLAEQHHRVFMGSPVLDGSGIAVVTATGMQSELGRVAKLLDQAEDEETPLQRQLTRVGSSLVWLCLAVVALVAAVDLARGRPLLELLFSSIALAVAAVPEGLPAIVTIALALGVQRMAKRHVLVRHLPAVEALGSTTVIATDKTGTLTTGEMAVREVWGDRSSVLTVAAACCDAELRDDGRAVGDASEVALLRAARELGVERAVVERENPRKVVNPFDSTRKRMSVLRADHGLFVKGAADTVLPLCVDATADAMRAAEDLSSRGLRVFAVAKGTGPEEQYLSFVGLVGIADPPRPSARVALADARRAGITSVMMTGDHPRTAEAIARELGMLAPGEPADGVVFARVTPEDKLRIVRELKAKGHVVAVTGDGTNDAPALKEAHVGIAMGRTGVEVTREAADLVLTDDAYESIVAGVREGRVIFANIRRSLVYLLGGNAAELLLVFTAATLALPVPLLPLHLLWINLVTESLPALGLVTEPAAADALDERPRPAGEPLLSRGAWGRVVAVGLLVGAVAFAPFFAFRDQPTLARSMAFATFVFARLFTVFASRSFHRTHFELGAFGNPRLLGIAALVVGLQLLVLFVPVFSRWLDVAGLDARHLLLASWLGAVPVTVLELGKLAWRGWRRLVRGAGHTDRAGPAGGVGLSSGAMHAPQG